MGVQGGAPGPLSPSPPPHGPTPWGLTLGQEQEEGPSPSGCVTSGRADRRVWDRGLLGPGQSPARRGRGEYVANQEQVGVDFEVSMPGAAKFGEERGLRKGLGAPWGVGFSEGVRTPEGGGYMEGC